MSETRKADAGPIKLDLRRFTFESLYYCQTPVTSCGASRFLAAINKWYLPFIRAGWAVPLAFILDMAMLLQRDEFRGQGEDADRARSDPLTRRYRDTLRLIRRQPVFEQISQLVRSIPDEKDREQAIRTLLKFLTAAISGFENIYSFDTRELTVLQVGLSVRTDKIQHVVGVGDQKLKGVTTLTSPPTAASAEAAALRDLLSLICRYFESNSLEQAVTTEARLVMEIAVRHPAGSGRVDYRFLGWLLSREPFNGIDALPPSPRMVEEYLPMNEYDSEGRTGGYVDINRKRFSGNVAEILPSEFALWGTDALMYDTLLNKGLLTYLRENFEYMERELRVLVCLVIDIDHQMLEVSSQSHPDLKHGITPYLRARAIAALLIQDLARFMPRQDVRLDLGVYLTSNDSKNCYRAEIDVFHEWAPEDARDRFTFLRRLVSCVPQLFYRRITSDDARANSSLETKFVDFMENRHNQKHYHCRHLVYVTSQATGSRIISGELPHLNASPSGQDSLQIICCDLEHVTLGIAEPESSPDALGVMQAGNFGQVSEIGLRTRFLETVFAKGAGRTLVRDSIDLVDKLT